MDAKNIWDSLSNEQRAAIRKLARGYNNEVFGGIRRRLVELGLADDGLNGGLTPGGFELHRAHPVKRSPRTAAPSMKTARPGGGAEK